MPFPVELDVSKNMTVAAIVLMNGGHQGLGGAQASAKSTDAFQFHLADGGIEPIGVARHKYESIVAAQQLDGFDCHVTARSGNKPRLHLSALIRIHKLPWQRVRNAFP